jgi:hypothetical protein
MPKAAESGQLISVDAVRGRDLLPCARSLLRNKRPRDGFSTWDASGIFFELNSRRCEVGKEPSAQTLLLLYAADLRFRLRWQIEPALAAGQTVVVAPYLETGIAYGLSFGLTRRWLNELFRFVPKADVAYWVNGTPPPASPAHDGFIEFSGPLLPPDFFAHFVCHFAGLEQRGKCLPLRP